VEAVVSREADRDGRHRPISVCVLEAVTRTRSRLLAGVRNWSQSPGERSGGVSQSGLLVCRDDERVAIRER
jgi:hypothetical protein